MDLKNWNILRYLTHTKKEIYSRPFPIYQLGVENNSKHGGNTFNTILHIRK